MSVRLAAVFAAALSLSLPLSSAGAARLDKLRTQSVEGGRLCISTHWHFMSSGAWRAKAQAMIVARRGWGRFTGGEYGAHWGSLRLAAGVDYGCSLSPLRVASNGRAT